MKAQSRFEGALKLLLSHSSCSKTACQKLKTARRATYIKYEHRFKFTFRRRLVFRSFHFDIHVSFATPRCKHRFLFDGTDPGFGLRALAPCTSGKSLLLPARPGNSGHRHRTWPHGCQRHFALGDASLRSPGSSVARKTEGQLRPRQPNFMKTELVAPNVITSKGSGCTPGISMPGEPAGMPATARPLIAGRSVSNRRSASAGTWPSST